MSDAYLSWSWAILYSLLDLFFVKFLIWWPISHKLEHSCFIIQTFINYFIFLVIHGFFMILLIVPAPNNHIVLYFRHPKDLRQKCWLYKALRKMVNLQITWNTLVYILLVCTCNIEVCIHVLGAHGNTRVYIGICEGVNGVDNCDHKIQTTVRLIQL